VDAANLPAEPFHRPVNYSPYNGIKPSAITAAREDSDLSYFFIHFYRATRF